MKRNVKTDLLIIARRLGMLCRKTKQTTHRIRISKTINPDGSITDHDVVTTQPINEANTFETELHIWNEIHNVKSNKKQPNKSKL